MRNCESNNENELRVRYNDEQIIESKWTIFVDVLTRVKGEANVGNDTVNDADGQHGQPN